MLLWLPVDDRRRQPRLMSQKDSADQRWRITYVSHVFGVLYAGGLVFWSRGGKASARWINACFMLLPEKNVSPFFGVLQEYFFYTAFFLAAPEIRLIYSDFAPLYRHPSSATYSLRSARFLKSGRVALSF